IIRSLSPRLFDLADFHLDPVLVHGDHQAVVQPRRAVEPTAAHDKAPDKSQQTPQWQKEAQILRGPATPHRVAAEQAAYRRPAALPNAHRLGRLARAVIVVLGKPPADTAVEAEMLK